MAKAGYECTCGFAQFGLEEHEEHCMTLLYKDSKKKKQKKKKQKKSKKLTDGEN